MAEKSKGEILKEKLFDKKENGWLNIDTKKEEEIMKIATQIFRETML